MLVYEDEVEKSSWLFQRNGGIVLLLKAMRGSEINKGSGNSCYVLAFDERRIHSDSKHS